MSLCTSTEVAIGQSSWGAEAKRRRGEEEQKSRRAEEQRSRGAEEQRSRGECERRKHWGRATAALKVAERRHAEMSHAGGARLAFV